MNHDAETGRLLAQLTVEIGLLSASHDRLLAAAKAILVAPEGFFYQQAIATLKAAIAAAEEQAQ